MKLRIASPRDRSALPVVVDPEKKTLISLPFASMKITIHAFVARRVDVCQSEVVRRHDAITV